MRKTMWIALVIVFAIVAVWWFVIRRPNLPDRVEKMGPLDLVTHTAWHLDGWNNGSLSWGTVESYSVNYHGKPFSLEGEEQPSGRKEVYQRCNAFFTFPSDPPAVVVNVGDPVNTSYFYLLKESPQGLATQYLTDTRVGPSAFMVDGPVEKAPDSTNPSTPNRNFASGHLLLLGSYQVLDTQTGHLYPIERLDGVDPVTRPLSVSPDKQSFVRIGLRSQAGAVEHVLLDTQFVSGHVRTVAIDRTRMRYNQWQEMDEPWVEHHFEWKQQAGGPFQLTARADFAPLPFHGNRSYAFAGSTNCTQYSLVHVKPEAFDPVVEFLSQEYPGSRQTTDGRHAEFRIEGVAVKVDFREPDLAIWCDSGTTSPVLNRVADRVDVFLKTGTCDSLFLPNP